MAAQPPAFSAARSSWIWTSAAFAVVVVAAGAWLVLAGAPRERARFVDHWRDQLSAMANDRHGAIESYVAERLNDTTLMASFPTVVSLLTAPRRDPAAHDDAEGSPAHLAALLGLIAERQSYRSAAVVSADGTLIASAGAETRFDRPWQALARRCLAERTALADLYLNSAGQPRLQFVAPVAPAAGSPPVGAVALTIDPEGWLYHFVSHQPVLSETAETLLVRRDGDDAVFLSPLRHDAAPPLTLRRPLSTRGFGASAALRREQSFSAFVDYRGTPIYAVTRLVANTPWALVVKVDQAEVLGGYRRWLASATLLLAASLLAVGGLLWGTWHHQRRIDLTALQASEAQLRAIFETAAIGMAQADPATGRWVRVNQRMCEITGYSAAELLAMRVPEITHPDDRQADWELFERVVRGEVPEYRLEKRYIRKDGSTAWVNVNMTVIRDAGGAPVRTIAAIEDIGERKRAEEERDITVRLLRLLNSEGKLHDLMREVTLLLHDWLGCDAVGIRLRAGDDFPYFETRGFPAEFVQAESSLCLRDAAGGVLRGRDGNPVLECMCGSVLSGRFDPAKPFFTARGSFWTNSTTELLATTTAADRQSRTRNRCNGEGYESVALVPMRVGETTLGLLQVNDEREGRFTAERIALLERFADSLAVAVAHRLGQQSLAVSEERYRFLFTNMLEGYAHCRMIYADGVPDDFVYLDVNREFVQLTGLPDVVGRRVSEVIPGIRDSNPELLEIYGRVASTGKPERFETFVEPLAMWFSISVYSPARDHFVAVFDVITERKRAEQELQAAYARLERMFSANIVGVAIADVHGGLIAANDYYLRLLGYTRAEFEANMIRWDERTPPEHAASDRFAIEELRSRGVCSPYEKQYLRKDGSRVWVLLTDALLPGPEEQILAFVLDITERKRTEAELLSRQSEISRLNQRLAELIGAVQALATARTLDEVATIVRTYARRLLDADGATFVLREGDLCHYFDEDAIGPLWKGQRFPIESCLSGWVMLHRETAVVPDVYQDPRGPVEDYRRTFVKSLAMVPIRQNDPLGAIGVYWASHHQATPIELSLQQTLADAAARAIENVRLLDELEDRVRVRTAQLTEANQELEAFSYSVSHDLRAPLRAIDGFSRLLHEDHAPQLDAEGQRLLGVVRDSARSMSQLIDDLLAFSRVGRAELHRGRIAMGDLVRSALAEVVAEATRDQREVRVAALPDAVGDAALIRQVWVNLLANAVKFTGTRERPVIEVFADRDGELVRYHVRDNGVGFDIAYADKLFGVFQRLHSTREFPGTGVGLALVRRIVSRHGGTTSAVGNVGQGAEFCFTLPPAAGERR